MNKNFCPGCDAHSSIPGCAITLIPSNVYLEDILANKGLQSQESFICHKNAQEINENKMNILSNCNECGLCLLACPYLMQQPKEELFNSNLERVILNDLGKASILFHCLFPDYQVASEVHVKGNFRTKRIDIVIKDDSSVYLIKLLKNTDKVPFYHRSYTEVINQYVAHYHDFTMKSYCLVPTSIKDNVVSGDVELVDIKTLYKTIGGK